MTMSKTEFPLDHYTGALVKFLDKIEYNDDNYDNSERLKTLQHVYSETAKHFAQPAVQDAMNVNPEKMAVVMRTSVQVTVYSWVKVPLKVLVAVSIYFVYIAWYDDVDEDPRPKMELFCDDLLRGKEQKHPYWRLMTDHLLNFCRLYGSFCGLAIIRSTFDHFQGCWIETNQFQALPGSDCVPLFLRRLNGLGHVCGASLFPIETFDEQAVFDEVTTVLAQIDPVVTWVNDLMSYYKEFDVPRDQINLVTNMCEVEGITAEQAFDRLTDDTVRSVDRLEAVFAGGKSPAVAELVHAFTQGYVTWHFCDERYRMREVYDRVGGSSHGLKFRQYYEAAMKITPFHMNDWAGPTILTNGSNGSSHLADEVTNGV